MEELNPLKEQMTAEELFALPKAHSVFLSTMRINEWFVKGQYCFITATVFGKQFPLCRYICIESGKMESIWKFDKEMG